MAMTDHPSTGTGDHNLPVLTVGEISQALKRHVEGAFDHVRVRGEISGLRRATSGHIYFVLKDETAILKGVCWRGTAARLGIKPEDGMDVVVTGRLTTYPGRSEYQMVAEAMELAGEGALLKLLEDRRKRLAAEGLFDVDRKRPIPFLPEVIGVVTSPTGAVIRDILHRLADRFPRRVLLWPVAVQGNGAAEQIAVAIEGFSGLATSGPVPRPDVLIVARGGGSLEDLWAFNEEIVVRAAVASAIPLIAAVGHETDTTLIDFAADRRAPTPTAAAEMAVPVRADLIARMITLEARQVGAFNRVIEHGRTRVAGLARGLPQPGRLVEEARQRLDDWSDRLRQSLAVGIDRRRQRVAALAAGLVSPRRRIDLERSRVNAEARALSATVRARLNDCGRRLDHAGALLESYSYQRVLERGFVLATDSDGHAVTSARSLKPAMRLGLRFHDGEADVVVAEPGGKGGGRAAPGARRRKMAAGGDGQGTLL
ncbi:MAG: exodeoxyribonuclease VII large subunit [Rhodospirillales bacterium]|nr:MAG: exodeoxyribonuclease VII large subunit [Rhodospirillales bacterium]